MNDRSTSSAAKTPIEEALLEQLRLWCEGAIERDSAKLSQVFAEASVIAQRHAHARARA